MDCVDLWLTAAVAPELLKTKMADAPAAGLIYYYYYLCCCYYYFDY